MKGGALVSADTMGPGKTAALSLPGYLFDELTLLALEEAGVEIEYPANLRESDQEPKKLKPVPADATQRAQYYADLRADDAVLLKDVTWRLGCQPRREKEPPWLPFGRVFLADRPNPQAAPIEIHALTRARYRKLVEDMGSSYEADLVSAWHQVAEASHQGRFHGRAVSRWESYCRESFQHFESYGCVCIYKSSQGTTHGRTFRPHHRVAVVEPWDGHDPPADST